MIDVFTKVVLAGACLFTFAWVILAQRRTIRRLSDAYLRLTHFQRVLAALAVVVCTVYAQKPSTNDVEGVTGTNQVGGIVLNAPQPMSNGASFFGGCGALGTVRPTVAVRPYRLESVTTNSDISYAMPAGGAVRGTWHLTGAYEDVQKVTLDGFAFPLGSDLCTSLWAYTWGKVRPQLTNASNEIAAVGAPMSAIPDVSRFWTAATSNDTYLLTWESFAAGRLPAPATRDASGTVNAQIELKRNGDFITRSNDVECVYRRVIEPNPIDYPVNPPGPDDPTKPLYPYGPVQDLSVIQETNAYCWVDIVVNAADAWVRFEGDGASNLADPSFAAKAGETNHVVILIGKTYKVTCDMPFAVVGKSDPAIDEWWEDGNTLWLNWPVNIWSVGDDEEPPLLLMGFGSGSHRGNGFTMFVSPSGLGGEFSWTNSCCAVYGSGMHFSYGCDGFCLCGGCSARGYYGYEGYRIGCSGGSCGCSWYDDDDRHGEDDPDDPDPAPSISVRFGNEAVIFEDAYTNMPGEVVGRSSTTTKLYLDAHGGMKGGTATFTFANRDKLEGPDIPTSINVPAGHCKKYEFTYRGNLSSGSEKDITVHGEFHENNADVGSRPLTSDGVLTSVKIELKAAFGAPMNGNENRHVYGVGESAIIIIKPQSVVATLTATQGEVFGPNGGQASFTAPAQTCSPSIAVTCKQVSKTIDLDVFEPIGYVVNDVTSTFFDAPNEAGLFRLEFDTKIYPLEVSFYAIQVKEVPVVSTDAIGYFAQPEHADDLDHAKRGARGKWTEVGSNNSSPDIVQFGYCAKPWNGGGSYSWPIPNAWRIIDKPSTEAVFVRTDQRFELDADGTARLFKFGYMGERCTNNQYRVVGGN